MVSEPRQDRKTSITRSYSYAASKKYNVLLKGRTEIAVPTAGSGPGKGGTGEGCPRSSKLYLHRSGVFLHSTDGKDRSLTFIFSKPKSTELEYLDIFPNIL